ncbi:nitroreductase family protein [Bacillus horti]|uniref:Nitroreductase n=1 Tax=Caldalkalibacillus horti TaxID=77523 RepID=A0ABT9W3W3_9BACI|nr:nitroreductase family protein [Bacillus horti]MDQ0167924.1 nitroreductase [Bacillus horti]
MSQDLLQMMNEIVNIRSYQDKAIPEKVLKSMYQAFGMGPTSISTQARELLVIEGQEGCKQVVAATLDPYLTKESFGAQSWLVQAPFIGVVLLEKRRAQARIGEAGIAIALQEAEAAIQNFRLLARSEGLATASVREFDAATLQLNLQLPWYMLPIAILTAGYSDQVIDIPPRFSLEELVSKGEWK